ncbi:MAG: hypothetical protein LAN71_14160 [Acidobacteriia bacterium]|nr:hypothetical protein [Terriglobia bacterium]
MIKATGGVLLGLLGLLLSLDFLDAILFAIRNFKSLKDLIDVFIYGFLSFSLLFMSYRLLREAFPKAPVAPDAAKEIPPPAS